MEQSPRIPQRQILITLQILVCGYVVSTGIFIIILLTSPHSGGTARYTLNQSESLKIQSQCFESSTNRHSRTNYPLNYGLGYSTSGAHICRGVSEVDLLIVVHSSLDHSVQRNTVRRTFANQSFFPDHIVKVVFITGRGNSGTLQMELEQEQTMFGDIVQGTFHDSFENLTLKEVTGWRWVTEQCPNVALVAKIDDDTFIHTYNILDNIRPRHLKHFLICNAWEADRMPTSREGRWGLSENDLKMYELFPWQYCSGFASLQSGDVIPHLYKASAISPFFWLEDVYAGMVVSRIEGLNLENLLLGFNISVFHNMSLSCFSKPNCEYMFGVLQLEDFDWIWKAIVTYRHLFT